MNASAVDKPRKVPPSWIWIILAAVILSVSFYVLTSSRTQGIGFPLDDAWIHQTYARNLADLGEWSFIPGTPSAGSTSPLWSLLLAALNKIWTGTPFIQTYALGAIWLWLLAVFAEATFRRSVLSYRSPIPIAGLMVVFEWHLVWAAASGMETLLIAAIIGLVLYLLQTKWQTRYAISGLVIGIGVWVRPETLTLLGPVMLVLLLDGKPIWDRLKAFSSVLGGLLLPFIGYLWFNFQLSGHIWPNTFYAKQAEYAALRELPLITRYLRELAPPLAGIGIIMLPGFLYKCYEAVKSRDFAWIGAILWWLGINLIYAIQLPVTYQHGRYLIPAMPVYFLIGLVGSYEGLAKPEGNNRGRWIAVRVWAAALIILLAVFYGLGARSYARDVAIINTEMVAAAQWLRANTQPDDLIAVHDIGAVGYFSQRKIIDLAGLVTPEIIPIIRNEEELKRYLDQQHAAYLMTFPDWYSQLNQGLKIVYTSTGKYSPAAGGENMTIYRWADD